MRRCGVGSVALTCPEFGWPTAVIGGLAAWAPVALMLGLAWLLRD